MGTTLPSIVAGDGADVATTANFRAVAPAGMYGTNPVTSSGLTWGYFGGTWGPGTDISNGTVVVGASTTTYVVASRSTGAVSSSTGTTNWNDGSNYLRIAELVSGASGITSIADHRPSIYNSSGGGGGSGTVTSVDITPGTGIDATGGPVTSSGAITVSLDAAAQSSLALADSAIQAGDLAAVATSGAAADVSIADAGGYFTATDVEGALQELGAGGGGGGQSAIQFQDEGSNLGDSGSVDTLDFVGSGVTAARVGNVVTVTVPGGGGGSGDVVGPASAVADRIAVFDGTTGKLIKDGGSTIAGLRTPNVQSVVSASTVTPTFSNDAVKITAQAAALTLANPTGTAIDMAGMVIRIKDNGTARAISYGTQYRAIGVTLPATTVVGKELYLAMVYNADTTPNPTWDVIAVGQQA